MAEKVALYGDWAPGPAEVSYFFPEPHSTCVFNFEGPLSATIKDGAPIKKAGPHLHHRSIPFSEVPAVANLANNHFMDFGAKSAQMSRNLIEQSGIRSIGFGNNAVAAERTLVLDLAGRTIGFAGFSERQFGSAGFSTAGVSVFNDGTLLQIREAASKVDSLVVSAHGGQENLLIPSPSRVRAYRALADAGARVIHGHHSHVVQGFEQYGEALITFGLGNLVVDPKSWPPTALARTSASFVFDPEQPNSRPSPVDLLVNGRPSHNPEIASLFWRLQAITETLLKNEVLHQGVWQELSLELYSGFLSRLLGLPSPSTGGTLLSKATKTLQDYLKLFHQLAPWRIDATIRHRAHLIWCNAHREALETAMGILSHSTEDLRSSESEHFVHELHNIEDGLRSITTEG